MTNKNKDTGYIWAICPKCNEWHMINDTKGAYNDEVPQVLCNTCKNKSKVKTKKDPLKQFIKDNNIKDTVLLKEFKKAVKRDEERTKFGKRRSSLQTLYKQTVKLLELLKEDVNEK